MPDYRLRLSAFVISLFVILAPCLTNAKISAADCKKIRTRATVDNFPIYFQAGTNYLPLTDRYKSQFWQAIRNQNPDNDGFTFIYLAKPDGDSRSTLFLVKQRFSAGEDSGHVGIYNNIRELGKNVPFDQYQEFHHGGNYQSWTQWLHLGPGWFFNRDFVDSQIFPLPREFFAFKEKQNGDDLKAYLIAVRGISPAGSCVDFTPYVPAETRRIEISIRNIRATDSGDFRDPFTLIIENGP